MSKFVRALSVISFMSVLSFTSFGQDHFGAYLTDRGVKKILTELVKNYNKRDMTSFSVSSDKVQSKIYKKDFNRIPIVEKLKDFAVIDMNSDIPFYIKWSPMYFNIHLDENSVKAKFIGSSPYNTQLAVRFKIDRLNLSGKYIELCEIRKGVRKCDSQNSLYGKFENYKVSLSAGHKIDAVALFKVEIKNGKASLKLQDIHSNLFSPVTSSQRGIYQNYGIQKSQPSFNVTFKNFVMPAPVLTVDNVDYEINVTKIKQIILNEKTFLSKKLVEFAGGFVTNDLSNILNKTFLNEVAKMNTNLVNYEIQPKPIDYSRNYNNYDQYRVAVDNTRVVRPIRYDLPRFNSGSLSNLKPAKSFIEELSDFLHGMLYQAKFNLSVSSMKTKRDGNLLVNTKSFLTLNKQKWTVGNTLKNNSNLKLKESDVEKLVALGEKFDFAAIVSEPIVNAVLKMGSDQRIFDKALKTFNPIKGVTLKKVSMYFEAPSAVVVVADIGIKMTELETSGIGGWIENRIGAFMEDNYIYFPLELRMTPRLTEDSEGHKIKLDIESPLAYKGLKNTYNHPYKDMNDSVENGVIDALKKDLIPALSDVPEIKLNNLLTHKGIELSPKGISVRNTGHIVIKGNIERIDLDQMRD